MTYVVFNNGNSEVAMKVIKAYREIRKAICTIAYTTYSNVKLTDSDNED